MRCWKHAFACVVMCSVVLILAGSAVAQRNTADLSGEVSDPQGLAVKAAKVTVTNVSTGADRTVTADEAGRYSFVGLPPGKYKLTVDGGANFALLENSELVLTVGSSSTFDVRLQLRGVEQTVRVTEETSPIETTKTEVSQTVDARRIDNLPINGRNYINFTLTNSQTTRDSAPSIGAAPTSGLNFGGQRARSNEVSVDGADAVDNSVNGIRSTVSQEAVQEFQLILSNYNAEYGRAIGGVVNIVTKGGSNDVHGNAFGFLRHKNIQARNPFSVNVDPTTGAAIPVKQPFTRVQAGATVGGPIKKDKTFYFFSFEATRREESGFTNIGENNFGLAPLNCGTGCALNGLLLTPAQASAVTSLLATGVPALVGLASQYAALFGSGSTVALNGIDPGLVGGALTGGLPGARFPIPVSCPPGATVNGVACVTVAPGKGLEMAPLPGAFVALTKLRGNYPVQEKTELWSARLDHRWSNNNNSFLRVSASPSFVTGIQVNAQNQNFGQNAGSRTSLQQVRDVSGVYQHDTIFTPTIFNQFRFQYARRGLHYGFSKLLGGSGPGVNIAGFAFFGREPFSTVDRIERRFQWTDHMSVTHGSHTFKMGGDVNVVQIRSKKSQIFELNFGSVINFGGLSANTFFPASAIAGAAAAGVTLPGTTGVQSYGLGLPTTFIQGIGNSNRTLDNKAFAGFIQDSWRVNRKLAFNYGVRYDVELTPLFPAATAVNVAAENALKVVEGIPRDYNNVAPRFGLAWDPWGNGKTVIRAGYGIFYDHPLLAVAFNATTAEGALSSQLLSAGGAPSACFLVPGIPGGCGAGDSPTNLNAASIFQGVLNALPSMGFLPDQQRFDPKFPNSLFANQNFLTAGFPIPILPFTLPLAKNFRYAYSQQSNLTIEREIAGSWKVSLSYQYTHGLKLNRPRDINSTNPVLLTSNLAKASLAGLRNSAGQQFTNPLTVSLPTSGYGLMGGSCPAGSIGQNTPGGGSIFLLSALLPFAAQGFTGPNCTGTAIGSIGTPAAFNFFRPSGPNPSFGGLAAYPGLVALATAAGFPAGFGVPVPFNSVDAQESSGNSVYHGLTFNLMKRFSHGFELLSSYTWSHAIDDSTDLQTLLEPQDGRFPNTERGNSSFDQRHRWVTSAVFQSSGAKQGEGLWKHLLADFTVAPIVEVASGRPFAVLTGTDFRLDLGASQGRPSVGPGVSSPFIKGVTFTVPTTCLANDGTPFSVPGITTLGAGCDGNLGRNRFVRPNFFQWDLRVARRFPIGERLKLEAIADMFNLFNRFNVADVSPLCNPTDPAGCNAGQPSAALDPRQFQFAVKLSW